ncbi:MAG: bifunctional folylpolyglutamate synthase/dihydrofolate synthase, partial [Thermoprotei archaeon]
MKFEEALDFLYGFKDFEKEVRPYRQSLFSFRNFLKYLGNPHEKIGTPIIVAGTKGKGSVATMLSYIIRESVG